MLPSLTGEILRLIMRCLSFRVHFTASTATNAAAAPLVIEFVSLPSPSLDSLNEYENYSINYLPILLR